MGTRDRQGVLMVWLSPSWSHLRFLAFVGSSSASSCEGRTVNSYWWCQRKWRRSSRGGLKADRRVSRRSLADAPLPLTPFGFCLHCWTWTLRRCTAMKETFQSGNHRLSHQTVKTDTFTSAFFTSYFFYIRGILLGVSSNLGNCSWFLLLTFPKVVQASAGRPCWSDTLPATLRLFALICLHPPSLIYTKACPYLCLILAALTPPLFLPHIAHKSPRVCLIAKYVFSPFPKYSSPSQPPAVGGPAVQCATEQCNSRA